MPSFRENILKHPSIYQLVQDLIGGTRARQWTIERYVHVQPGQSILDLGCGPGDLLRLLPPDRNFHYLGVDLSEDYLRVAEARASGSIRFVQGDCGNFLPLVGGRRFDWIVCMGLLHHLSDDQCDSLLAQAALTLVPDGTLVCLEPVFLKGQNWLTREVMNRDRGRFIRLDEAWSCLYRRRFKDVKMHVLAGAFRIPYAVAVAVLRLPVPAI